MTTFLLRRLLLSMLVLVAVSYGSFVLVATKFTSTCASQYTPSTKYPPLADSVVHATALWGRWLRGLPSGKSFADSCNFLPEEHVATGLGHTAALLATTVVFVLGLSLVFGLLAAVRAGSLFDLSFRVFSYTAWAIPSFLLALVLQTAVVSMTRHGLHVFPVGGWPGFCPPGFLTACITPPGGQGAGHIAKVLQALVVPSLALAFAFVGFHSRYLRSSLLVALSAPYTNTARAKGLSESRIVLRHALRNSIGVFASVLTLDLSAILGASLAVDFVFHLGGLGLVFLNLIGGLGEQTGDHAKYLDAYAVMSVLTVTAIVVAVASIVGELILIWLDPRMRPA